MGNPYDTSWRQNPIYNGSGSYGIGGFGGTYIGLRQGVANQTSRSIDKATDTVRSVSGLLGAVGAVGYASQYEANLYRANNARLNAESSYYDGYASQNYAPGFNGGRVNYGGDNYSRGGYGQSFGGRGQGYANQNGPDGQFVRMVFDAQSRGDQAAMQRAVDFGASIAGPDGMIHFGRERFSLPNGRYVEYNGEVQSPREAAQRLSQVISRLGFGRVPVVAGGTAQEAPSAAPAVPQQSPVASSPSAQAPATVAAPAQGAAPASVPQSAAPTATETSELPPTTGAKAPSYRLKAQAAPSSHDKPANLTTDQVTWLQNKLNEAGITAHHTTKHPDGVDGKYGQLTANGLKEIADKVGVKLSELDFGKPGDPETKKFLEELNKEIAAKKGIGQQQQGPSAAEIAAQETARRAEAERAAAAAAEKARIDQAQGPLLGSPFDARNLPQDYNGRYAMAREALLDIRELHSERRLQSNENLHDKMKEAVRDANKLMEKQGVAKRFQSPAQDQPFTDDAMQALGIVLLEKGKMRQQYDASVTVNDPMAAALAAASRQGVQPLQGANPQAASGPNGIAQGGVAPQGASQTAR